MRILALSIVLAVPAFHTSTKPLPPKVHSEVKARYRGEGCPVPLSDLRLLTVAYLDRSNLRKGMVTPAVVGAFASVGWGWGGSWTGDTKDYMHFSYNGH